MDKLTEKEKRHLQLDEEELEILDAFEAGELKGIAMGEEERGALRVAAAKALEENDRVSVRIPERDLKKIKMRARKNGIPFQTLITALLHQYAEGKINATL